MTRKMAKVTPHRISASYAAFLTIFAPFWA
jgi:hypothetical protein